jgi:hypothetical protein
MGWNGMNRIGLASKINVSKQGDASRKDTREK